MIIDVMKLALEVLSLELPIGSHLELKNALRAAIEQAHGDWDEVEALRASLREHMAEIHRLRQWQGLTDEEVKAPIQKAMQYFGYDSTQYSLGGAATIGFLGLVREIEAKLREKNDG